MFEMFPVGFQIYFSLLFEQKVPLKLFLCWKISFFGSHFEYMQMRIQIAEWKKHFKITLDLDNIRLRNIKHSIIFLSNDIAMFNE